MSDFQKSVDPSKKNPTEWISEISQLEKDKREKEENEKKQLIKNSPGVFSFLLNLFKKIFKEVEKKPLPQLQVLEDLFALKELLQNLTVEDLSHNAEYVQALSEKWNALLFSQHLFVSQEPRKAGVVKKIIEKISAFPEAEEHSLGYYLTEFVGKEWLPFPFIDLLHQIHQQYKENATTSILFEWIDAIDQVAFSLKDALTK